MYYLVVGCSREVQIQNYSFPYYQGRNQRTRPAPLRGLNVLQNRDMDEVKALLFDVFGTVVDWRSSVVSELEALGEKSGIAPGKSSRDNFSPFLKLENMIP